MALRAWRDPDSGRVFGRTRGLREAALSAGPTPFATICAFTKVRLIPQGAVPFFA